MSIVGEFNKNLDQLEKLTNTKIYFRVNSMTVKGSKNSVSNFFLQCVYRRWIVKFREELF